jgi:hypothetical protein
MTVTHNIEWLHRAEAVIQEVERWMQNFLLETQKAHIHAELGKYAGLIVTYVEIKGTVSHDTLKTYYRGAADNYFVRNIQLIVDCYYENWETPASRRHDRKLFPFNPPTLMGDTMLAHGWGSRAHLRDRVDDYDDEYYHARHDD